MVPIMGTTSNSEVPLIAEWNATSKHLPEEFLLQDVDIEKLFDTLAEWNDILEKDVPYFQEL